MYRRPSSPIVASSGQNQWENGVVSPGNNHGRDSASVPLRSRSKHVPFWMRAALCTNRVGGSAGGGGGDSGSVVVVGSGGGGGGAA